jgi:hypothetical protein
MRRPSLPLAILTGAMLMLAACASPGTSARESTGGSTPTAESNEPEESSGGGGGGESPSQGEGGGFTGEAPALADGPWTSGQGAVTVSGAVDWETDEPITTDVSETTDAKTELAYNSDDTYVTIFINLTGVPFHASVTSPDFDASSDDCDVTYARADDTGIDATFSCVVTEFHWLTVGEAPTGAVMIEGSFTASR